MSAPSAKVLRNGEKTSIPARELVVGDIVSLEAGDFIPADGRLIDVQNLRVEGMLTGESEPVEKFSDVIEEKLHLVTARIWSSVQVLLFMDEQIFL